MYITSSVKMQNAEIRKINVLAVFAAYKTRDYRRKITPLKFKLESGESHKIANIRRVYTDKAGNAFYVHYVVESTEGLFYDIVYDTKKACWFLVVEDVDSLG